MTLLKQSDDYFSQVGAIFREGKGVARQLKSGVLQSRDLTRRIFQSGNDDFINQLERQLPPDVWNNLKAQNLADRLEDFSRPIERLPGVRVIVKTDKFKNWVSGNADVIRNVYGQDTFRALQNFAEFSAHAARDISAAKQELAASIAATAVGGTALGYYKGAAGFSEPSVIFGSAGMMAMAHSLMSPNGILKNWLTNGLPRVAVGAEQAAKLGLRFGMSGTATEENAPAYANMMAVTLAPGGPLGKIGASIAGEALRKGMEGEDIDIEGLGGAGLNQAKKELFKKIPGIKASYHAQRPSKFKRK